MIFSQLKMDGQNIENKFAMTKSRWKCIGHKCVFCDRHQSKSSGQKYHRFPKNPQMSEIWAEISSKKWVMAASVTTRLQNHRVCSAHFSDEDYLTTNKTRLKALAIPLPYKGNMDEIITPKLDIVNLKEKLIRKMETSDITADIKPPLSTLPFTSSLNSQ